MYLSRDHYAAVVIGSGFGGAVAAARLAQAGVDVAVVERGRRWTPGEFPRDLGELHTGWVWLHKHGLYDIREFPGMMCVTAAGWGGGSLVYANVAMRPPPEAFDGWPRPYRRPYLDPFYDLAAHMLKIGPVPERSMPPKAVLMSRIGDRMGAPAATFRPNLAVTFTGENACIGCGECDIGCNVGAKNTLDRNYLRVAEAHGAEAGILTEVTHLERNPQGYRVFLHQHADGGTRRSITAERVFVCAGALGSTELLLRSRDQYGTLPDLPVSLGTGYSGNGDFLSFGYGTADLVSPGSGPTITTATIRRTGDQWFLVEDGGYSGSLAGLVRGLQLVHRPSDDGERTAVLLAMGRDRANGRVSLRGRHHRLHVDWPARDNLPLYAAEQAASTEIVGELGGRAAATPTWRYLRQPVSVHNLGGCRMGPDGVVDTGGQVYGHPGLYVLDGAILPAATGVNPSATIAAVAEHCIQQVIREWHGDPQWTAPERPAPVDLPEDRAFRAVLIRPMHAGISFAETMRGSIDGRPAYVDLTVVIPDLDAFLADERHTATVTGTVHVRGLTGPAGAPIGSGALHLLARTGVGKRRTMAYRLAFTDGAGEHRLLHGAKDVWHRRGLDVWAATTTLRVTLTGPAGGDGTLRLGVADFAREMRSMRSTGTGGPGTVARFVRFIATRTGRAFNLRGF